MFAVSNAGGSSVGCGEHHVSAGAGHSGGAAFECHVVYNTPTTIMAIAGGGDGNPLDL